MKDKIKRFSVPIFLIALFAANSAVALDVQIFRPNHNRGEGLTNYSSSSLYTGEWQTSLFLNYANNPLQFGFIDTNSKVQSIVDGASTANFLFSYGLSKYLTLGIDFPLHLLTDIQSLGTIIEGEDDFTPGDPRVFAIIPLLRAKSGDRRGFGLALVPNGTFSFGNTGDFLGNKGFTAGAKLVVDAWFDERNYVALNAGYTYRQEKETIQNLTVGNEYPMGLTYTHVVAPKTRLDLVGELYGSTSQSEPFKAKVNTPVEALLAVRKRWDAFALTFGGGRGLTNGYGSPDYRVFAGLTYSHLNENKKPEPKPEPQPTATPEPVKKDGVLVLEIRDEKGAPVTAEVNVLSEDGKFKNRLKTSRWQKDLPAGTYQVSIDVPNFQWVYREVRIESGEKVTESITLISIKKKGEKIDALGKILFDTNQDTLRPESYPVLDHVVKTLSLHPEILKIRIEAHTDGQSSDKYNLNLSNRRALTVYKYFIRSGVDTNKLSYRGYGEAFPVDSNDTEEGRANNRRVEFVVLDANSGADKQNNAPASQSEEVF